ncbi:MAG: adenylate/guanylate cyclase domain-containing protein, partial [Proteobacteria bacterium]|nr:adenylate/guanylate cyclase domain-containing protein [Pseudomonadota bacterium]
MIYTRMKILVILLFCMALFSGCAGPGTKKSSPFAEKGILDLRNWNFEKDGIVALNGQWEFFWQSLLNPQPLH